VRWCRWHAGASADYWDGSETVVEVAPSGV
jgi:hypothetical protein